MTVHAIVSSSYKREREHELDNHLLGENVTPHDMTILYSFLSLAINFNTAGEQGAQYVMEHLT